MVDDSFQLRIEDALHDNDTKQVQIYSRDLALIPYLRRFGRTALTDNSAFIGIVAGNGELRGQNYIKFDSFLHLRLNLKERGIVDLFQKRYHSANSIFESAIPAIIAGTPQSIAKELKLRPYQKRFDLLADFIRRIQPPYDSSLERLIREYNGQEDVELNRRH